MATVEDLNIDQGSRFIAVISVDIEWLPTLAGYDARGTVRESHVPAALLLADLTPYLTVDEPNSLVTLDLPANVSAGWAWTRGHFDMEVFDGNPAHDVRFIQGEIIIDKESTT
jgi:hypothetical protein